MKKLQFTKQALDFFEQLDAKQYRQVGETVFRLLADAEPADSQALKGAAHGEHRVDVGEYRIFTSPAIRKLRYEWKDNVG